MQFPTAHTCHANDPYARLSKGEYRPRDAHSSYRTCDFCGSIHPEEFLEMLANGARLEVADWKYGWPHKVYVSGLSHAKFYTAHIADEGYDDEARAKLIDAVWRHTGIYFEVRGADLMWAQRPYPIDPNTPGLIVVNKPEAGDGDAK